MNCSLCAVCVRIGVVDFIPFLKVIEWGFEFKAKVKFFVLYKIFNIVSVCTVHILYAIYKSAVYENIAYCIKTLKGEFDKFARTNFIGNLNLGVEGCFVS